MLHAAIYLHMLGLLQHMWQAVGGSPRGQPTASSWARARMRSPQARAYVGSMRMLDTGCPAPRRSLPKGVQILHTQVSCFLHNPSRDP